MLPELFHGKSYQEVVNVFFLATAENVPLFMFFTGQNSLWIIPAHIREWPNEFWEHKEYIEVELTGFNKLERTIDVKVIKNPFSGIVTEEKIRLYVDLTQTGPDVRIEKIEGLDYNDDILVQPDDWFSFDEIINDK